MTEFAQRRNWGPLPKYERVLEYQKQNQFIIIAGPCSLESEEQIHACAEAARLGGATHLRGGVFRAGTYPGQRFGLLEERFLKYHQEAAHKNGLKNIMEVLDYSPESLKMFDKYADCLQIGSRSMQNYTLLKKVSELKKQTFLKRHQGSTTDEWLGACEYLLKYGDGKCDPVLIERGSSTYHNDVRWCPTIHTIPSVKSICNIPIIIDGAHSSGRQDLVAPITLAGVAAGADGLLCEIHPDPKNSLSDPDQALTFSEYINLMIKVSKVRGAIQ